MKRLGFIITFFALITSLNAFAMVFDPAEFEHAQAVFKTSLQTFKTVVAKKKSSNTDAIISILDSIDAGGLAALENNPRVVRLAVILVTKAALERSDRLSKEDIDHWANAKMQRYTPYERWAAHVLMPARFKELLAYSSASLRWARAK